METAPFKANIRFLDAMGNTIVEMEYVAAAKPTNASIKSFAAQNRIVYNRWIFVPANSGD